MYRESSLFFLHIFVANVLLQPKTKQEQEQEEESKAKEEINIVLSGFEEK